MLLETYSRFSQFTTLIYMSKLVQTRKGKQLYLSRLIDKVQLLIMDCTAIWCNFFNKLVNPL